MRNTILTSTTLILLATSVAFADVRDRFSTNNLRGRYTGTLTLSENIQVDQSALLQIEGRVLMALRFDGKSEVSGVTSVSASIPGNPPANFTCVFTTEGTYEIGDSGLGTATLNITPTSACAGPATLKLSLLVGGRNSNRVDVTIDGASGLAPDSVPIAIVGGGSLSEQ